MLKRAGVCLSVLLAGRICLGDVYQVTNTSNAGTGSLRWAVNQANNHLGADTITFAPALKGQVIQPRTQLPTLWGPRTTIKGDIDGDGAPDIWLRGRKQGVGHGIDLQTTHCRIIGLAITHFPGYGIHIVSAHRNTVRACHIGVNLAGAKRAVNLGGGYLESQVFLEIADYNTIKDNVIGVADDEGAVGIRIFNSSFNTVSGNTIGLTRDGMSALGKGFAGVEIFKTAGARCRRNTIGGTTAAERNLLGGLAVGIGIGASSGNTVSGNYLGLARDGNTLIANDAAVHLSHGAKNNTIGGATAGAGNVFAGSGIAIINPGTASNKIQGNYFGTNAAGTRQKRLDIAVSVEDRAGAQLIGGDTPAEGNLFNAKFPGGPPTGIELRRGGRDTVIKNNRFGLLASGKYAAPTMERGVHCIRVGARIEANTFGRMATGLRVERPRADPRLYRNVFRKCGKAVELVDDAHCYLGDVGTGDPGENLFRPGNLWFIYNDTANDVVAEGNGFGTKLRAKIDPKIHDHLDNGSLGTVDYDPLIGGASPTGQMAQLALTSVSAIATSSGAEILFALSAPAEVQALVLNIAGRPVRTLCRTADCEAGTNTLLWNTESDRGLAVPNGTYVVEVVARGGDGTQARGLAQVKVSR